MIRRTTPWRKSRTLEKFLFLRNLFRPRHRLMVIDVTREFALHKSVEKNAWRSNPLGCCQGPVNLGVATRKPPQPPRLATSRQRLPGLACRLQAPVRRGAAGRDEFPFRCSSCSLFRDRPVIIRCRCGAHPSSI